MNEREPGLEPGPASEGSQPPAPPARADEPAPERAHPDAGLPPETAAPTPPSVPSPAPQAPSRARRPRWSDTWAEGPAEAIEIPRRALTARSRRDFLLFTLGLLATAAGAWWLLPERTRSRLVRGATRDRLDTLAARVGLTGPNRERALDRVLAFDDDVAEALYSKDRRVRTYPRSRVTPLRNNYHGRTPGPEYLATWTLGLSGLHAGREEHLPLGELLHRIPHREQVTRLVCVEGWSAVAWWGGIRFADLLAAFPPAPGARWAAMRSSVSLDARGRPEPYYVSIDLDTARHPQTLLATHQDGRPLSLAHGAPMRLLAPMKLGLKNIKALTDIAYTVDEPPDYWNEQGYSRYDGL